MKSTNEFDYLSAIGVANANNYFPVSPTDETDKDSPEVVLQSKITISPENAAIKNDGFEKLSEEAKQIIMLIVWGPIDFFEQIETRHFRKITLRKIRSYFGKQYGRRKTSLAIKEIQKWIKEI